MNVMDYIKKYKDYDFIDYPFTDIDNLIFSMLAYLPLEGVVPAIGKGEITLTDACVSFFEKYPMEDVKNVYWFLKRTVKVFQYLKKTKRYGSVIMCNYEKVVDDEKQFGAVCFKLCDDSMYVAFEGTDASIIGWLEDLEMAYKFPIASQRIAPKYLNKVVTLRDKTIRVGGHSKGGNLAMCAVMYANFWVRRKVINIYNNDGPGFLKEQIMSKKYKMIAPRIKMFVPRSSIVGMILYHQDNFIVVNSSARGVLQHDGFTWLCNDSSFVVDELSKKSRDMELKLTKKIEELSYVDRKKIVTAIEKIFKDNDIKYIDEIKFEKFVKIIKDITIMDKSVLKNLIEILKIAFL